jgi:hypothetical protein
MRIQHTLILGISFSLMVALPALADQQGNASGQGSATVAPASQPQSGTPPQAPVAQGRQVYGWQLMTPAERTAFQQQMRSMKTDQEREALRLQHHEQMKKRAAEQGVTLPDVPLRQGGGMGPGNGMGPGGGMGPGKGPGGKRQPPPLPPTKDESGG